MNHAVKCLLLASALWTTGLLGQEAPIDIKVVKYDGLTDLILKNRGKVVVIDFWATY